MKKSKVLYYVIKYENKYYAPYQSKQSFDYGYEKIENILTNDKRLALRFGTKELAQWSANYDATAREYCDHSFDLKKARVVRVVSKGK